MNKSAQCMVASVLGVLALVALVAGLYLTFMFPKTVEIWSAQGRALSVVERLLVEASQFCKQFGLLLIPALLASIIGCGVWVGLAARKNSDA